MVTRTQADDYEDQDRSMTTDEYPTVTFADGISREYIPYGEERPPGEDGSQWTSEVCHDCGVTQGEIHKVGCDVEECPKCGGQYFACECKTYEKAALWDPDMETPERSGNVNAKGRLVRGRGTFAGDESIAEMIESLETKIRWLRKMDEEGWELRGTIADDAFLRRTPS